MIFDYVLFCEKLTVLRKAKGYSKYLMSIYSNINYSSYCDIENGKRKPDLKDLLSIANVFEIGLLELTQDNKTYSDNCIVNMVESKIAKITDKEMLEKIHKIALIIKIQVG